MKKIKIISKQTNEITHLAKFETQEECNAWIQECESVEAFGKPEHQIVIEEIKYVSIEVVLDENDNIVEEARTEVIPAIVETIPAEYTIEIEDISSEVEKQQKLEAIEELEAQITPRRIREAILTGDNSFILSMETQIEQIRNSL